MSPVGFVDTEALISAGNWKPSWIGTVEPNREGLVRAGLEPTVESDLPAVWRIVGVEGAAVEVGELPDLSGPGREREELRAAVVLRVQLPLEDDRPALPGVRGVCRW